jgi:hypothetical protein
VYALGATLYECLAGRPPFEGATTLQLFQRIVSAPPAPLREHAPGVDVELERIVLRALAKRRDERQPDASALESELRAWLARSGETSAAPAETAAAARGARSDAKRRWSPRHAALIVVLAAGAWFASSRGTRPEPDPAAPVEPDASRNPTATAAPSDARPARVVELLGAADLPFGRRLDGWERTLGPGTFGDDEDSSGVVGLCRAGLALKPLALSSGSSSVRGVLEPLDLALESTDAESPPRATGIALEWQDGRILAAGIVVEDGSARLAWCALARNDAGAWSRSRDAVLLEERGALDPWSFHLRFDAEGVQLEWPGAAGRERVERAPSRLVGPGHPLRFHAWVEQGAVRCTRFVLEDS